VNSQKLMGCRWRAAIPMMTTLAPAATAVVLPPKSAPNATAHHSDSPCSAVGAASARSSTMGASGTGAAVVAFTAGTAGVNGLVEPWTTVVGPALVIGSRVHPGSSA
jgi:hypothetical protein